MQSETPSNIYMSQHDVLLKEKILFALLYVLLLRFIIANPIFAEPGNTKKTSWCFLVTIEASTRQKSALHSGQSVILLFAAIKRDAALLFVRRHSILPIVAREQKPRSLATQ